MSELHDIIRLLNPWWEGQKISETLVPAYKREAYKKSNELKKYRQIIIVTGLRRVGKTTVLYQTIKTLTEEIEKKKVFYFNFDKEVEDLIELFEAYKELTSIDYKTENISVFFDEITKYSRWANELKLIYDSHPNIKFYISSSSSVNLEESAVKNLAGRYFLINMNPLSFKEFLELKNKQEILEHKKLYEKEIKREYAQYILRSFPETINWDNELIVKDYLKTTIIDKIIKSDLPERFKNINKDLLYSLIELIYKEPGIYIDYDNLSKSLRISKNTLFKHMFYLEFCYLIKRVKNFRPSTLSTTRKLQRAYPYWWSLAYCYGRDEDRLLESLVISTLNGRYYWRDGKKEIDLLHYEKEKLLPIEVKNKEQIRENDMRALVFFMKKYKIDHAKIVYLGNDEIKNVGEKTIALTPVWNFLLGD